MGSFWLWRAVFVASKLQPNARSGAGSFLIRGKVRRVQIEVGGEPPATHEGDAAAASPPAAIGWPHRRGDDVCT